MSHQEYSPNNQTTVRFTKGNGLLPTKIQQDIRDHLDFLYGSQASLKIFPRLVEILQAHHQEYDTPRQTSRLSHEDVILITYADQIQTPNEMPLETLANFITRYLHGLVNAVHILPFYPYSSDDGFSVIDYRRVNSDFGSWDNIQQIGISFRLMVDAVINHISSKSAWFQAYLQDMPPYSNLKAR